MGDINLKSSENLKSGSILINAQDLKEDLEKLEKKFLFKKKKKKKKPAPLIIPFAQKNIYNLPKMRCFSFLLKNLLANVCHQQTKQLLVMN